LIASTNEGLANWNKVVKPNVHGFKPFRESNNWVDCEGSFLVTLEAHNLTHWHLIDLKHVVINKDLDQAQQKFTHKVMN